MANEECSYIYNDGKQCGRNKEKSEFCVFHDEHSTWDDWKKKFKGSNLKNEIKKNGEGAYFPDKSPGFKSVFV